MEKEEEEKDANAEKPETCEDEAEGSPDKEKKEDKWGKEEVASINSPLRLCNPLTPTPRLPDQHWRSDPEH